MLKSENAFALAGYCAYIETAIYRGPSSGSKYTDWAYEHTVLAVEFRG